MIILVLPSIITLFILIIFTLILIVGLAILFRYWFVVYLTLVVGCILVVNIVNVGLLGWTGLVGVLRVVGGPVVVVGVGVVVLLVGLLVVHQGFIAQPVDLQFDSLGRVLVLGRDCTHFLDF